MNGVSNTVIARTKILSLLRSLHVIMSCVPGENNADDLRTARVFITSAMHREGEASKARGVKKLLGWPKYELASATDRNPRFSWPQHTQFRLLPRQDARRDVLCWRTHLYRQLRRCAKHPRRGFDRGPSSGELFSVAEDFMRQIETFSCLGFELQTFRKWGNVTANMKSNVSSRIHCLGTQTDDRQFEFSRSER